MGSKLKDINTIEELEGVLADSSNRPALLFKHSVACPISARAFHEFESFLESANPAITYRLITVQTARPVSDEAASRLSLRHETPQAILINNGREVWNASHHDITSATLQEAVRGVVDRD